MRNFIIFITALFSILACESKVQSTANNAALIDSSSIGAARDTVTDTFPKPLGWVSDFENILTDKQEKYLDSIIKAYEKKTTIEIAVVTLDSTMTKKEKFNEFAVGLTKSWGVGKRGKNNGITICISGGLRTIRINNGYGIEEVLSNDETKQIIEKYFIPYFRKGDHYSGIKAGLKALMAHLDKKPL
jgi:uncharacterized protein